MAAIDGIAAVARTDPLYLSAGSNVHRYLMHGSLANASLSPNGIGSAIFARVNQGFFSIKVFIVA